MLPVAPPYRKIACRNWAIKSPPAPSHRRVRFLSTFPGVRTRPVSRVLPRRHSVIVWHRTSRSGFHQTPEPFAVMSGGPSRRRITMHHRPHGASDPDAGINVDDPNDDRSDGRQTMDQQRDPLLLYRRIG